MQKIKNLNNKNMAFKMKGFSPFTQKTKAAPGIKIAKYNVNQTDERVFDVNQDKYDYWNTKLNSGKGPDVRYLGTKENNPHLENYLKWKKSGATPMKQTVGPKQDSIDIDAKLNKLEEDEGRIPGSGIKNKKVKIKKKRNKRKEEKKSDNAFMQSDKGGKRMMKKELQIKKKPNLKNMSTDALLDSLYNMPQNNQADFDRFNAYKSEVLRRNPKHDWGMNVDEMD